MLRNSGQKKNLGGGGVYVYEDIYNPFRKQECYQYKYLLYLLYSTRATIGQFSGPYSTVRLAKSKTVFWRALFQDKEI